MPAETANNFVLQVQVSGTFTTVGGFTTNSLSINNELVDITDKSHQGYRTVLEGQGGRTMEFGANGVFQDDAAMRVVRNAANTRTLLSARMITDSGDVISGLFMVSSLQFTGDVSEALRYQITLQSSGSWSWVG